MSQNGPQIRLPLLEKKNTDMVAKRPMKIQMRTRFNTVTAYCVGVKLERGGRNASCFQGFCNFINF